MKKIILKLLFPVLFLFLANIGGTSAYYSDSDTISENTLSTGWWVLPSVEITAPNGGENWRENTSYNITWTASSFDPDATTLIDLYYSTDGGVTYPYTIATSLSNSGSYPWTVGSNLTSNAKVKVTARDSHGLINSDESNNTFLIIDPLFEPTSEERVSNGNFNEGTNNWNPHGETFGENGGQQAKIGIYDPSRPGNPYLQNYLSQTIDNNNIKNVLFEYNFNSYDYSPYDSPGFRFTVNNQVLLDLWAADINSSGEPGFHSTGWQMFAFDPVIFPGVPTLSLNFFAGNSGADGDISLGFQPELPSWVDIKGVTTTQTVSNPALPEKITGLDYTERTTTTVIVQWVSNGAVAYDLRYWTSPIDESNFSTATRVDPWPIPRPYGKIMETTVSGLSPSTNYYFAVKSVDATPLWSDISDIISVSTLAVPSVASPGDIIINEVMWMGSTQSYNDEWIELYNTTENTVDLNGWKIDGAGSGTESITLSGTVPAHGYYLVSHYGPSNSNFALNDSTVVVDQTEPGISLLNGSGEQLALKATDSMIIDRSPLAWPAGYYDGNSGGLHQSMERNDTAGDGMEVSNWHTCNSLLCNSVSYWKTSGNNYGTPGFANLSLNDKTSDEFRNYIQDSFDDALESTKATDSSKEKPLSIALSKDDREISFSIPILPDYSKLTYELTYDTNVSPQGAIGSVEFSIDQKEFSRKILLGTCSSGGTCVYHKSVNNIKLLIEILVKDGNTIKLEKTL